MRVVFSAAASLLLVLALVGPVAATEPGPGCSDFAANTAATAQAGGFGQLVASVNHGAFEPAFTGVGQLIRLEHTVGIFTYACEKYR
jgi:hypothetical protein